MSQSYKHAKLAQTGKCQTGWQEAWVQSPLEVTFLVKDFICFPFYANIANFV